MARTKIEYKLPPPVKDENGEWLPVVRVGAWAPFGYENDPDDDILLKPIPHELELLELAKKHLKTYSYRAVAAWLSEESGRHIDHSGLKRRIDRERKHKAKIGNAEYFAKKYKEAEEKVRYLEERALGRREGGTGDDED